MLSTANRYLACTLFALTALSPALAAEPDTRGLEFFEKKIRPVLIDKCFRCHSSKAKKIKGGLRLDTQTDWRKGGDTGPAIVPGDVDRSLLIQALRYNELEMPPDRKLSNEVIDNFVAWVKMGAPAPKDDTATKVRPQQIDWVEARRFWSFQPIKNPEPPQVKARQWTRSPIDHFVLARLENQGLQPVAPANKRTLIRRASFDLIGLPPTPAEIESFLQDNSPTAFARVVDRLLASPHYGERWARHWLDIARYGEDQAHSFKPRMYPHGYRYRDWLIKALNDDMPYDRFVKEQIAGDLLEGPNRHDRLPALGFFALGPVYYGDRLKFDQIDDRIDTLARGFLGLTVACARCHDHKYDPIPTKDYYSLAGIVASSSYTEAPMAPAAVVETYNRAAKAVSEQDGKIKKFLAGEAKKLKVSTKQVEKKLSKESKQKLQSLREDLARLQKAVPPKYAVAHSLKEGGVRNLKVNIRGNPKTPGEEAPRGFLTILSDGKKKAFTRGSGRLELAEAIASPDNPLTARVIVNRIWQHHFGRGLVSTPSNFGKLGARPSHPLLLDYLAGRLIALNWSMKALHREIMLSATYRLSSRLNEGNDIADPENVLLWRMNRRRLEVEAWRDAMLAVSGQLDARIGGPSLDLASAQNRRRTLYARISRHDLNSLLRLFDFPDPNITSGSRSVTTVPLQQLFVLNSDFMTRQAKALAGRLTVAAAADRERIKRTFVIVFGRPPTDKEVERGLAFLHVDGKSTPAQWEQYAQVLLSTNGFMYVD